MLFNVSNPNDSDAAHDYVSPKLIGWFLLFFVNTGLLFNVLVSLPIVLGGLLTSAFSVVYKPIFSLLISDSTVLVIYGFYLAPSIIVQRDIIQNNLAHKLVDFVAIWGWMQSCLSLCLLSVNRYFGICHPYWGSRLFTHRKTTISCFITWPVSFVMCFIGEHVLPCCRSTFKIEAYCPVFEKAGFWNNVNNLVVLWPINLTSTVIFIFCYASIFWEMRASNRRAASMSVMADEKGRRKRGGGGGSSSGNVGFSSAAVRRRRHRQEVRFALQFCAISVAFNASWILFRVLPPLLSAVDADSLQPYAIVTLMTATNMSLNSFIYLLWNADMRARLNKILRCRANTPTERRMYSSTAIEMRANSHS